MSIPEWIYFAMGAVIARILLDGTKTKGYRTLEWLQLVFNISRIVILWPLVLFVEKIEVWLKHEPQAVANPVLEDQVLVNTSIESRPVEIGGPIFAADVNEAGGKS